MKNQVIVAAGGSGERLKSQQPKALMPFGGKPLVVHALEAFQKSVAVESIIVVAHADIISDCEALKKEYALTKIAKIVPGGANRCESVKNGLAHVDTGTDFVLIHDAARPFITVTLIEALLSAAYSERAVIPGVRVRSTIKVAGANGIVQQTLARDQLWEIQTPQVFKRDIIVTAHEQHNGKAPTDDASLVEDLGIPVKIVEGDYRNIKITTPEDLTYARVFLEK